MSFLHPEFFYYGLVPVLLLFAFVLRQKSSQENYFSSEVMEKLRVSANTLSLNMRNWLFLMIAILILIALSGPIIDEGTIEVKAKSADIMVALDISDSMLAEDVYPNRLKLAKQKALELLKLAPTERIGVIAFAKNSYLVSPLSFDSNAVAFLLRELRTDSITEKGTNFLSMLAVVDKSIKKESKKYLLILSDGGDKEDFAKEIEYAKENSIVVFVLALGTSKGAPIKREDGSFLKHNGKILISKLNENISMLATKTGGVYIESVNSNADIQAMLREIEAHSEKKELKSQEIKRYIPLFYFPLALALFILLIATSSVGKKTKKSVVSIFILVFALGFSQDAEAGVTEFMLLDKAKEAYQTQEYEKAQKLYEQYSSMSQSAEVDYNIANTLYKREKYKEAQVAYEKLSFDEPQKQAKNYANLGNSYVKGKTKEGLQKAVEAYENSLEIQEDKDVRDNLEAVKKAIQEQEKEEDKKDKKDKNDKQDKKDKSDKEKNKDKNKSDKKDKSDNKDDKSKDDKKSDKKSEDEKKKDKDKDKSQEEKDKDKKKKDETKELKDTNASKQEQSQAKDKKNMMSDEEEKKWLKQLSKQQSTFLYRLNDDNKFEDNTDEKPW
ncbi:VWA domain-containing protein [Sulfurimonas sp. SAG-AH-194-C21]|nr:VWA domain-containing protein [Sulfurimonas sp. SAG-AH-194-C21]MDF1882926.1 VWA domain-containing protein [Sulfurimonas sp. SAG-AH-194-C21]